MLNLLDETEQCLSTNNKGPSDVRWVEFEAHDGERVCTWDGFASIAKDFDYDDGYGCAEVNRTLRIVGRDWWLERHVYDGSERWDFKGLADVIKQPTAKGLTILALQSEYSEDGEGEEEEDDY